MILLFCRCMKPIKYSFILAVLCCSFLACKKSDNKNTPHSAITIQGFYLTDYNGNFLGWNGPADSDWLFRPGLSAAELALFNFDTQLSLDNTTMTTVPSTVIAYPNPASVAQIYYFSSNDSNVIKLVIVDSNLNVLTKTAFKWGSGSQLGGKPVQINLNDKTLFPDHSSRRAYFSYSAKDHPDYKAGYGDIRICYGTSASGCF
jgi:hypothetical protein